jgi:uncharacterized protein YlxP (DUF503 family)
MEKFPVISPIEQAINKSVNALVGNNDVNFNTIVKMAMLNEIKHIDSSEMQSIIANIAANNEYEKYCIEQEYQLTIDCAGNIIPINDIDAEKREVENDSKSVILESERSE